MKEKQITFAPHGHMLTNAGVWSPDGHRIVYDVRSGLDGSIFDGTRIETVDVRTSEVGVLYETSNGACCGVATCSPVGDAVVFILGPERPTPQWQYGFHRRQGVMVRGAKIGAAIINLDARNLAPPFTPGALRGGTHLHLFSPDGRRVSFTYHDLLVPAKEDHRNIGVSLLDQPVVVPRSHPRNHDGSAFSVVITQTTADPAPGSDEIGRACEEAWLGRGVKSIAFQGEVMTAEGKRISEVFVVDLPDDLTAPGDGPLEGTTDSRPAPPRGTVQRRVTFTKEGLSGPRHWLKSTPDGSHIGFLMRDGDGVTQFWTVAPNGEKPRQITRGSRSVESAFSWSEDGRSAAMVIDTSIGVVDADSGQWRELTHRHPAPLRPEACVFSPGGGQIAYMRVVDGYNQIFVADVGE